MRKINLTVQIKIDEDKVKELYPDFDILFENIEEFIEAIYNNITTEPGSLEELGYSVQIKEDSHILPLSYSLN